MQPVPEISVRPADTERKRKSKLAPNQRVFPPSAPGHWLDEEPSPLIQAQLQAKITAKVGKRVQDWLMTGIRGKVNKDDQDPLSASERKSRSVQQTGVIPKCRTYQLRTRRGKKRRKPYP